MNSGKKLKLSIFIVVLTMVLISMIICTISANYIFSSSQKSGMFFGKNVFVMNSDIMEPEIEKGSVVIANSDDISVLGNGCVVLFADKSGIENIMRIIDVDLDNNIVYSVAGDNAQDKVQKVPKSMIIAKCEKESQRLGAVVRFLKSITGVVICMIIPCFILLILLLFKILSMRKRRRFEEDEIVYPEASDIGGIGSSGKKEKDYSKNPLFDPAEAPKPGAAFEMKKSSIAEHFGVKPGAKKQPDGPSERNVKAESALEKFKAAVEEKPASPVSKKVSLAPEASDADKSEKMAAIKAALNDRDDDDDFALLRDDDEQEQADSAGEEAVYAPVQEQSDEPEVVSGPETQSAPEVVSAPEQKSGKKPKKETSIKSIDDLIKVLEEEKKKL